MLDDKIRQLKDLFTQLDAINAQIASILGGSIEHPPKPTPRTHVEKGRNECSQCGKPGHSRRTCGDGPVAEDTDRKPPTEDEDKATADKIRLLWVQGGMDSKAVCEELKIGLGRFNRLIMKYHITKT